MNAIRVTKSALLPYSREDLFDLVADVESYPEFVPGWSEVRVLERKGERLWVEQSVGIGPFHFTFRSEALLSRPNGLTVTSRDSPLGCLTVRWSFEQSGEATRIDFEALVEPTSAFSGAVLNPWFEGMNEQIFTAFIQRAKSLCRATPHPPGR